MELSVPQSPPPPSPPPSNTLPLARLAEADIEVTLVQLASVSSPRREEEVAYETATHPNS